MKDIKLQIQLFKENLKTAEKELKDALVFYSINNSGDFVFNSTRDNERKLEKKVNGLFMQLLAEFEKIHDLVLKEFPKFKKFSGEVMGSLIVLVNTNYLPALYKIAFQKFTPKEGYIFVLRRDLMLLEIKLDEN